MFMESRFTEGLYRCAAVVFHGLIGLFGGRDQAIVMEEGVVFRRVMATITTAQRTRIINQRTTYVEPDETTDTFHWNENADNSKLVFTMTSKALMRPHYLRANAVSSWTVTLPSLDDLLNQATDHLTLLPSIRTRVKETVRPLVEHKLHNAAYIHS